jgi:hypothetical protein
MSEVIINKVSDAIKVIEDTLKVAVKDLDQTDQVSVERLATLDGYLLKHPRGTIGLLYNGSGYEKRDDSRGNVIFMKRNILIGVVAIIRFFDNPQAGADRYKMMPSDYVDTITDAIAGIEVQNNRPEYERKMFPVRDELVDEENGVWKYLTTFSVPIDYIEKNFRESF